MVSLGFGTLTWISVVWIDECSDSAAGIHFCGWIKSFAIHCCGWISLSPCMLRQRKRARTPSLLPRLPSLSRLSSGAAREGDGEPPGDGPEAQSVRRPENGSSQTVSRDSGYGRRRDMPLRPTDVQRRSCGSKDAVRDADNDDMNKALRDLDDDMFANSTKKPREALLRTWTQFHSKWYGDHPVLPLTPEKITRVSALFKLGGYKAYKNYLARAKEFHVSQGYPWSDLLDHTAKRYTRSVLRGVGAAHRSENFDLQKVLEAAKSIRSLSPTGPFNPVALVLTATVFLLRELEASAIEMHDVTLTDTMVTLRLPVSKVDWQAKGCTRSWNCVCVRPRPPLRGTCVGKPCSGSP